MAGVLTLCMIVRDEEAVLPRCLDSVAPVVDEMVVVDTGSQDATAQIARDRGAVVLRHEFSPVDFAAARNRGLERARGDSILVVDADETLDPASRSLVRAHVEAGEDVGWIVRRRNLGPGSPDPVWVDHAVRLFPNHPAHRYRNRVHETVDASILAAGGRLRSTDVTIDHHLPAQEGRRAKGRWYLGLLLQDVRARPDDVDRLEFLAAEYHQLGMFEDAIRTADRICSLEPDDVGARINAALYHLVYAGDAARARTDLAAALALRPHDPEALGLLAAIDSAEGGAQ